MSQGRGALWIGRSIRHARAEAQIKQRMGKLVALFGVRDGDHPSLFAARFAD